MRVSLASVPTAVRPSLALGAALLIGVGYVDPGNWATDFDAARFGTTLLTAVIASGVGALLLQVLVLCQTTTSRTDLASNIVEAFPRTAAWLWPAYALAIVATEVAEFTGVVAGLSLLTGAPSGVAVAVGAALFVALLFVGGTTLARFERFAAATMIVLTGVFVLVLARVHGAHAPVIPAASAANGVLLAVLGIVGATIMPHNLFLHGVIMRRRLLAGDVADQARAERRAVMGTGVALSVATAVNGAILLAGIALGASTVESAFASLARAAGAFSASLFGAALIAAGLAAAGAGVCAGDAILRDGMPLRLTALQRRALAVVPAAALLAAGVSASTLLVASQVVLACILPAVIVPLLVLALRGALRRTLAGAALLISGTAVAVAACAGDLALVTSLFHV